jgi:hypothetical protein
MQGLESDHLFLLEVYEMTGGNEQALCTVKPNQPTTNSNHDDLIATMAYLQKSIQYACYPAVFDRPYFPCLLDPQAHFFLV